MDNVVDRLWTAEAFLAWEDQQECRHEFDGRDVIAMNGGSVAHQEIKFFLRAHLGRMLAGTPFRPRLEMRVRIGDRFRYPDVVVTAGPVDQTTRTLTDAAAIFEILPDDTEATDRVTKLGEYGNIPSLRTYVLLEQAAIAAMIFRRGPGGAWTEEPRTTAAIDLAHLGISLPLEPLYEGLTLPPATARA